MADAPSADALAALKAFNAKYPAVGADAIQLLRDLAVPLKAGIDAAVQQDAPSVPLVRGWIVNEADSIVNQTIDNFINGLDAAVQTNAA